MEATSSPTPSIRRVAIASFIGTTIEWYDFFLTGAAAALVFDKLFFPNVDPATAKLASFATFSVGFIARPIGGIVCGHFGDKIGRKSMLVLTLLIMGIATFLIGCLPTYSQIGIAAPILLVILRLAQGFGVGGEWGGAVLMAVEHAPKGKRGFYGSWPQVGVPAGLLLATGVFRLARTLPDEAFLAWGWRVAFLLSVALIGVGLFIRLAVVEPPAFAKVKATHTEIRLPLLEVLRHPKNVLVAAGARLVENAIFYLYSVFILRYATAVGFAEGEVLAAVLVAAALTLVTMPAFGALSDYLGRRPVYLMGALFTGAFAFPFFAMVDSRSQVALTAAVVLGLAAGHAAMYGPQASFFSELFGTRVRYSGASLGYQLSSVLAGGFSPLLAQQLLNHYQAGWPIALFIVLLSMVTITSVLFAGETANSEMDQV